MKAHDAMTKNVITVGTNTAVREIAALLVQHRISAVPVVSEEGRVIGIAHPKTPIECRRVPWKVRYSSRGG